MKRRVVHQVDHLLVAVGLLVMSNALARCHRYHHALTTVRRSS